jgi:hypothetical protein
LLSRPFDRRFAPRFRKERVLTNEERQSSDIDLEHRDRAAGRNTDGRLLLRQLDLVVLGLKSFGVMRRGELMATNRRRRVVQVATLAMLTCLAFQRGSFAQSAAIQPPPSHIVIPFLANATTPADLDFEGGECEVDAAGSTMDCTFQQVFLTKSGVAPDTCLITTNRYQRTFRRDTSARWVSTEGPEGVCGLLDIITLQDGGGVRWTMETRRVVTKTDTSSCPAEAQVTTFSWQNIRRPLPCRFVQPGGLSR